MDKNSQLDEKNEISIAKNVVEQEIKGLQDLLTSLDNIFLEITHKIIAAKGRVIFSGMGKSGHIAKKASATFASTGTPSFFIHPAEASHGDLGMIREQDIVILLSNSGETSELNSIIDYCKRFHITVVGICRKSSSTLAKISDISVVLPNSKEASSINAPTTSAIMMMSYCDAIAITLQEKRQFSKEDFKLLHPGGNIGAKLLKVSDVMHVAKEIPIVSANTSFADAIIEMNLKRLGCTGVVDEKGELIGMITDGDLRRHINVDFREIKSQDVMTKNPISIDEDCFVSNALFTMNSNSITQIFVVEGKKPIGIIHLHDLLKVGVV